MTQYFQSRGVSDAATATRDAIITIGRSLHHQALTIAYADAFALMGGAVVLALAAVLCLRRPAAIVSTAGAH